MNQLIESIERSSSGTCFLLFVCLFMILFVILVVSDNIKDILMAFAENRKCDCQYHEETEEK